MPKPDFTEIVEALHLGVAVINSGTGAVEFENPRFAEWFSDVEGGIGRVPGFDLERAADRAGRHRPYSFETNSTTDGRTNPLRVSVQPWVSGEDHCYLLQVEDLSKEYEIQYMLDSYSKMAEKNARDLARETERAERTLLNIMPKSVLEEMNEFGTVSPQRFDEVSVLMLDFVGFTDMTIADDPSAIISELNDIFTGFDRIAENFGCERLKTIGDAYMAVSGLPDPNPDHAAAIARLALRFRRFLERRNQAHPQQWIPRIGINTGPVIGSLVGVQKYVYDAFGPGVNLAARMETASEPMRITLNQTTHDLLANDFVFTDHGEHEIKGFGTQHLYFLESEIGDHR